MLFSKKFYSIGKNTIFQENFQWTEFSTQTRNKVKGYSAPSRAKVLHNLINPPVAPDELQKINEITGITIKMGHTTWAKICTKTLNVVDWNSKSHAGDFQNLNEKSIFKLACMLKQVIPASDLYVIERNSFREVCKNLNDMCLASMLLVLLNISNGIQDNEKVVFQETNIMNKLHKLVIGNERISARKIFETMCCVRDETDKHDGSKSDMENVYSLTKINLDHLQFYDRSSSVKQECLSLVLLLTLSFIDVFIYQNEESLRKIQMQSKFLKNKK